MVVTSSLARGLLRDAIARQSVCSSQAWERANKAGLRAPPSLRRFREWFAAHERTFQSSAILIAYGKVGRRRCAFTSYMPAFCEDDQGWVLKVDCLHIQCEPGRILHVACKRLPITVCGHALERMFQRGETLAWADVRNGLADALVFFPPAYRAYAAAGYLEGPLPVSNGLLVGRLADGVLELKTFLQEATLRPRHADLLADFRGLLAANAEAFHFGVACGDPGAVGLVTDCITARQHRWLREPHRPGDDWVSEAWASCELEVAQAG
jgi:hypothetical protein